ncbi:MAG: HAD-IA family hydrolase, partial [Cyclobacteriaceae bacterium]
DDSEKIRLADKKNAWFVNYINEMKKEEIFPGVISLLQSLREKKTKIALASSSKNAKTVIDKLEIRDWFEVIVDGTMITHSKPDPEIFLLAAERLGLEPKDCIVVEDAEAGVEAAKSAGMKCIGIGSVAQLGKADVVVNQIQELNTETLEKQF